MVEYGNYWQDGSATEGISLKALNSVPGIHVWRREPILASCPLMAVLVPWHARTHTQL